VRRPLSRGCRCVGEAAVVEDLEEDVPNVGVGFFDLGGVREEGRARRGPLSSNWREERGRNEGGTRGEQGRNEGGTRERSTSSNKTTE
jgi:hypothetical protein